MSIEILDKNIDELREAISAVFKTEEEFQDTGLNEETIESIKNIVSTKEIVEMFANIKKPYFYKKMSYEMFARMEEAAGILSNNLRDLKNTVDIEQFLSKGYNLDIKGLAEKYRHQKLHKQFPDLDFKKIKELYVSPPKKLQTIYDENLFIDVDDFVFRKYLIAIIQMIFNHMDFVVGNVGDEGAGKSCKCSQDIYIMWWIMTQIKLIDYPFQLKEMLANTLQKFQDLEDKYYGHPFRIIGLDEGNELNRQDWKEDPVKMFWQRLRRERFERRIKFINIPVLGEMIINIVISRLNFIFNVLNKNEVKTGTLYKGDYDFFIIPRGEKIYSPHLNRELSKEEIKNKLYINLKDKEYLKGLPKDIKIKKCHFNGVWGFEEKEYIKEMKETNKQYRVTKGIRLGMTETFAFYKANITMKKIGIKKGDYRYPSLNMMIHKIKKFWNNDLDLLMKYENILAQKREGDEPDGKEGTEPDGKE